MSMVPGDISSQIRAAESGLGPYPGGFGGNFGSGFGGGFGGFTGGFQPMPSPGKGRPSPPPMQSPGKGRPQPSFGYGQTTFNPYGFNRGFGGGFGGGFSPGFGGGFSPGYGGMFGGFGVPQPRPMPAPGRKGGGSPSKGGRPRPTPRQDLDISNRPPPFEVPGGGRFDEFAPYDEPMPYNTMEYNLRSQPSVLSPNVADQGELGMTGQPAEPVGFSAQPGPMGGNVTDQLEALGFEREMMVGRDSIGAPIMIPTGNIVPMTSAADLNQAQQAAAAAAISSPFGAPLQRPVNRGAMMGGVAGMPGGKARGGRTRLY